MPRRATISSRSRRQQAITKSITPKINRSLTPVNNRQNPRRSKRHRPQADKENDSPEDVPRDIVSANKIPNLQRKIRHLKSQRCVLENKMEDLKDENVILVKEHQKMQAQATMLSIDKANTENRLNTTILSQQTTIATIKAENRDLKRGNINLKKKLERAITSHRQVLEKAKAAPAVFKLMHKRTYTATARRMARILVTAGCARSKVGHVIACTATMLGVPISSRKMSPRAVSRVMLEGLVAAKCQIGYEASQSQGAYVALNAVNECLLKKRKGLTISADSTSNRGNTYESRHIAMRVPDYTSASGSIVDQTSIPKNRLLGLASCVDHSANASADGFINSVDDSLDTFNRSPLGQRLQSKMSVRKFLRILKGMNGDHASKEKSCAKGIENRKKTAALEDLGEEALLSKEIGELILYLQAWNTKKIAAAGGEAAWNALSPLEQTKLDSALMSEIIQTLGKEEYDQLTIESRRELDLFIWAGCCMHKNENSFRSGSLEMSREWEKLGITPPILLANKGNSAILHRILKPGEQINNLSEDEKRAFEDTTRGGVKTTALAGAIFNHKDDKKGQGDRHAEYFKEKVSTNYTRFPDTSNTRFGSHGDGATDLIHYLEDHLKFLTLLRTSKNSASLTQIEQNVLNALQDIPTLTELCAMTLYHQALSKPYMRTVRAPDVDTKNVLDLGPFHVLVHEFAEKICNSPEILVSEEISHVEGTLDGQVWDNPQAIAAVLALMPSLPHLRQITATFFRGSLATWKRFSSEFAPGGLIDTASASEKQLAWMPTTNDVNEGALGAYRVQMRGKPSMTLHQYNARAMVRHNQTQEFIDNKFNVDDHIFVMREARKIDESKVEAKRKRALVDFRVEVGRIRQQKEAARQQKVKDDLERLSKIVIISNIADIYDLTVGKLGDQMDAIRFRGLPDVPPKSRFPKKAERQAAFVEILTRYQAFLLENGLELAANMGAKAPIDSIEMDWEAAEEAEDEE